jgi:hypothetical protein
LAGGLLRTGRASVPGIYRGYNRVPVEKGGSYGYAWLARTIFCFSLPLKKKQLPISNYILCFPYLDKNSQMASDILEVLQQTRPSRHPYSSFIGSIK